MRSVWKFEVSNGVTTFEVSKDAEIVSCGVQGANYYIWVSTETGGAAKFMTVRLFATGERFDGGQYILRGSIHDKENGLVWHVGEEVSRD